MTATDVARDRKRNAVEWMVFSVGSVLTLSIMVFLAMEAVSDDGDVDLRVSIGPSRMAPAGVTVPIAVRNAGDRAALDVSVEVCDAGGTCRSFAFPQLPGGSTREWIAIFPPHAAGFVARIASFQEA